MNIAEFCLSSSHGSAQTVFSVLLPSFAEDDRMLERRSAGRTRRPTRIPKVRTTPSRAYRIPQQVVIMAVAQPIDTASYTFTFSSSPCFVSSNLFLLEVLIPIHPPHLHLQQTIDKFLQKNLKTCEFSVVIIRKPHECSSSMSRIRKTPLYPRWTMSEDHRETDEENTITTPWYSM